MNYNNYSQPTPPPFYDSAAVSRQTTSVMRKVYLRMFIGLLITAFVALGVAGSPAVASVILGNQIIFWGMLIAMFVMAWIIPSRLNKMQSGTVLMLFCIFSALMGAWLAPIFYVYKLGTIAYTFFITSWTFGAMSVYGYFTKTNLDRLGSYLIMALFGLIILIVANIFLHSSRMEWIVSILGVLIFVGLTAWDTQQVKRLAAANLEPSMSDKLATIGAMNLYLDFINLFLYLLRFMNSNR